MGCCRILVLAIALVMVSRGALADEPWRASAAALPQYCQDRVNWTDPDSPWKKWRDYFGSVGIHMSHYCAGIDAEIKAKSARDKRERDRLLGRVIHQMGYVGAHCDPKCVIYADLHRRWAWALTQQGKVAEAAQHTRLANAWQGGSRPETPKAAAK